MRNSVTGPSIITSLEPASYRRHALHADACTWVEKNCYIDLWIEVLHAFGLEPHAMLSFTAAIDFEGDQWTFFKPPLDELYELYGVDVQELNVWRPLLAHAQEHLAAGSLVSTEADAFWLPDTAGTDYRRQHTKTTIVIAKLDLPAQRLGYFHNAGYFELNGEDFVRTFRLEAEPDPTFMPLFAELIHVRQLTHRSVHDLRQRSLQLLSKHLARRPATNPVERFRVRFERDLPWLSEQGLLHYHAWAFATIRQLGAAFELLTLHLRWLQSADGGQFSEAANAFAQIGMLSKTLILKAARAVNTKRSLDSSEIFAQMTSAWQLGQESLSREVATTVAVAC